MELSTKRRGGAARTMRVTPLMIFALIGACEEGDALPDPSGTLDGGIDAATPDAQLPEVEVDASFCAPREAIVSECVAYGPPSVACGTLTCSGATPRCCTHNAGADAGPSCVAANGACTGGEPFGGNIVSTCDDAADCQPGEVCRDSYNEVRGLNNGARCIARCSAGDPQYRPGLDYQVCTQSCECGAGLLCVQGRCASPP